MSELEGIAEIQILLTQSRGANSRRRVLETLKLGSKNCSQIAKDVKLNWRTTNGHLKILTKGNLVRSFVLGQRTFYRLTSKGEEVINETPKE